MTPRAVFQGPSHEARDLTGSLFLLAGKDARVYIWSMLKRAPILLWLAFAGTLQCTEETASLYPAPGEPDIDLQIAGQGGATFVGMEPILSTASYATEENFYQTLNPYFHFARKKAVLPPGRSIVVLPEHTGTWLVATAEHRSVFEAETIDAAMQNLVLHNLGRFLKHYLFDTSYAEDRLKETLFRMKAASMATHYQNTFRRLARQYQVFIVAGSIVLPHPEVENGQIIITDGPLENASFVFRPDGSVDHRITRKTFPIIDEKAFLQEASLKSNMAVETPIGPLYTMICADSWFPQSYDRFNQTGAELLAVPSMVSPADAWNARWKGYNGYANPADVDPSDIEGISEKEAWHRYAMNSRLKKTRARAGINVFFRGRIWDLTADGQAMQYLNGRPIPVNPAEAPNTGRIVVLRL